MTENPEFPPADNPESTDDRTAEVLPFPLKKTAPADSPAPTGEGVVKPGEWEAELPDTDDPEAEGLTDGAPVDPPRARGRPAIVPPRHRAGRNRPGTSG